MIESLGSLFAVDEVTVKAYVINLKYMLLFNKCGESILLYDIPVFVTVNPKVTQPLLGMDLLRLLHLSLPGDSDAVLELNNPSIKTISAAKQLADGYYDNVLVHTAAIHEDGFAIG